jgi:hypothetical protein
MEPAAAIAEEASQPAAPAGVTYGQSPLFGGPIHGDVGISYGAFPEAPARLIPINLDEAAPAYVPLGVKLGDWNPGRSPILVIQGPANSGRRRAAQAVAKAVCLREPKKPAWICQPQGDEFAAALSVACKKQPAGVLIVVNADEWTEHTGWGDDLAGLLTTSGWRLIVTTKQAAPADQAAVHTTHLPQGPELEALFFSHGRHFEPAPNDMQLEIALALVKPELRDDGVVTPAAIANLWRILREPLLCGAAQREAICAALGLADYLRPWFDRLSPAKQAQVVLVTLLQGLERGRLSETVGAVLNSAGMDEALVGGVWLPDTEALNALKLRRRSDSSELDFELPSIAAFVRARLPEFAFLLKRCSQALDDLLTPARRPDTAWRCAYGLALGRLGVHRPSELCDHVLADWQRAVNVGGYALAEASRSDSRIVPDVTRRLKQLVEAAPDEARGGVVRTALYVFPALVTATSAPFALAESCATAVESLRVAHVAGADGLRNDLCARLRLLVRADPPRAARQVVHLLEQREPPSFCGWLAYAVMEQLGVPRALETWGLDFLRRLLKSTWRGRPLVDRTLEALETAASVEGGHFLRRLAWSDDTSIARALQERWKRERRLQENEALRAFVCEAEWALGGAVAEAGPLEVGSSAGATRSMHLARVLSAVAALPADRLVRLWSQPLRGPLARAVILRRLRTAATTASGLRWECQALRAACDAYQPELWRRLHAWTQAAGAPVTYARPADASMRAVLIVHEKDEPAARLAPNLKTQIEAGRCEVVLREVDASGDRPVLCGELEDERRDGFDLVVVVASRRFADLDDWRTLLGRGLLVIDPQTAPAATEPVAPTLAESLAQAILHRVNATARAA